MCAASILLEHMIIPGAAWCSLCFLRKAGNTVKGGKKLKSNNNQVIKFEIMGGKLHVL